MDRVNFMFRQILESADMREIFQNNIENAIKNIIVDFLGNGIASGLKVTEDSTPSKNVTIKAGVAYLSGSRMANGADFYYDLNYSIPATEKRITSLCLKPKRVEYDQRQDGYGNDVYFRSDESFEIITLDGTVSNSPIPPVLQSDLILIADITLIAGQSQILNSDISFARVKYLNENNKKLIDTFSSMLEKSQNLNDLNNKATARTNLDVYNKSEVDTKDTNTLNSAKSYTDGQTSLKLDKAQNLNDLNNKATARTNLDVYNKSDVDTKDTNTLNSAKSYTDGRISNHDTEHDDSFVRLSGLYADFNANFKTIYNLYKPNWLETPSLAATIGNIVDCYNSAKSYTDDKYLVNKTYTYSFLPNKGEILTWTEGKYCIIKQNYSNGSNLLISIYKSDYSIELQIADLGGNTSKGYLYFIPKGWFLKIFVPNNGGGAGGIIYYS